MEKYGRMIWLISLEQSAFWFISYRKYRERGGAFCHFRVKKVQLSDSAQGTRSPFRQLKRSNNQNVKVFV